MAHSNLAQTSHFQSAGSERRLQSEQTSEGDPHDSSTSAGIVRRFEYEVGIYPTTAISGCKAGL
jgi:hypothetical protein